MSNVFKSFGLVIVAAIGLIIYSTIFIVDQRESALIIRLGEIQRTIEKPGFYFKLPVIDDLVRIDKRIVLIESLDKSVQVVDGRRYRVDAATMLRVVNPQKFQETVGASWGVVRDRLETRLDAALRQTYGRRTFDAALSKDRAAMMREIRDQVRREALSLGIDIVDVRIRRTDLMPDVLKDTYDRMNAERFAEAAQLRAIGDAQRIKIKAEADRQAVEMVAIANKKSEIIRGQGEAKRNEVFAAAFSKDPEFFAFYRSMKAYAKSLSSSNTSLVLRPDSEFFKYFGRSTVKPDKK